MRAFGRLFVFGAAIALLAVIMEAGTSLGRSGYAAALIRAGFGGAVLVGDGEVFAGEAANSFRPGMVYVYRKAGQGWQQAATITAPAAAVGDGFGSALELDGTRLFVGANSGNGAVHIYEKTGANWVFASSITAADVDVVGARFGSAIAASGEWLMIGQAVVLGGGRGGRGGGGGGGGRGGAAPAPDVPSGAVYVFRRMSDGRYAYRAQLSSADTASGGDGFGAAIDISDSTALIAAVGQQSRAGVVHEFTRNAAGDWLPTSTFAPLGAADNDAFGTQLHFDGSQVVVSAPGDGGGYGALFIFRKAVAAGGPGGGGGGGRGGRGGGGAASWQEVTRLAVPSGNRTEGFGASIAADEREVWASAPQAQGIGGVYLFSGNVTAGAIGNVDFLSPPGLENGARAGASISLRGNVAAVGATGANANGGGLVIYERDRDGAWREMPLITTPIDEIEAMMGTERRCSTKDTVEMFSCTDIELLSFVPPSKLTHDGHSVEMNDIWGWTDPETGKEWALLGRRDGATFVDISNPLNPVPVADLPLTPGARPASWRDIKVYKDHAYIVSDGAGAHGMQVFDLTRLRTLKPQGDGRPVEVASDVIYREINSSHNIVINEESGYAYSVGSSAGGTTCGGGLHIIDIREPKSPKFVNCFADTTAGRGYSHDAQCVTYKGPDTRYTGHEICIGANESAISIADVTDKQNPKSLASATYPNVAYSHQGWFTEDHKYFFLDDEIDEIRGVPKTRTMIWDFTDLEKPVLAKEHMGVEATSDHNLYIRGNLMYQANYRSGLRILDISDPLNPKELGHFDTAPYTENAPGYNGAWSVYPFFKSGTIIVSSIEQGLFMLKKRGIVFQE